MRDAKFKLSDIRVLYLEFELKIPPFIYFKFPGLKYPALQQAADYLFIEGARFTFRTVEFIMAFITCRYHHYKFNPYYILLINDCKPSYKTLQKVPLNFSVQLQIMYIYLYS